MEDRLLCHLYQGERSWVRICSAPVDVENWGTRTGADRLDTPLTNGRLSAGNAKNELASCRTHFWLESLVVEAFEEPVPTDSNIYVHLSPRGLNIGLKSAVARAREVFVAFAFRRNASFESTNYLPQALLGAAPDFSNSVSLPSSRRRMSEFRICSASDGCPIFDRVGLIGLPDLPGHL